MIRDARVYFLSLLEAKYKVRTIGRRSINRNWITNVVKWLRVRRASERESAYNGASSEAEALI